MAVDKETVVQIARLARIRVPEAERDALARELSGILGWIEQLGEVATDGVAPLTSVVARTLPLRDDRVSDGGDRARVLANAPEARDGFFVVPKVIE